MVTSQALKSNYLYFTGLLLLVAGMPVSLFLTSLSQFVLAIAFFLEGNFLNKFRRFFLNKPAMLLAGLWFMHIIGLLWTSDMNEAIKDIRIKLPLLVFPIIIAGSDPILQKQFRWVMSVFIFSVFCGTMVSMAVLIGIINRPVYDIRDIFIFHISHIRFALFICIVVCALLYFLFRKKDLFTLLEKILLTALLLWFLIFLLISESVTGISILLIIAVVLLVYLAFQKKNSLFKFSLLLIALLLPLSVCFIVKKYISQYYKTYPYYINTQEKTKLGNDYTFILYSSQYESGYPVWTYICDKELREAWNSRSKIPFDSLDERKQYLRFTLIRFLTSKGLRKDADAVNSLSIDELRSIEKGIANRNYQNLASIKSRLMQIIWEFDHFMKGGDPSGHSVMQRIEFWKAASKIIEEHTLIGVGTGDMPQVYKIQYEKMNSKLSEKYRLRAHNQFLSITVAFGILGLMYFIFTLLYPMIRLKKHVNFFYITFWIIIIFSMFTEDTLETQPGATFFAFFNTLFLFGIVEDKKVNASIY